MADPVPDAQTSTAEEEDLLDEYGQVGSRSEGTTLASKDHMGPLAHDPKLLEWNGVVPSGPNEPLVHGTGTNSQQSDQGHAGIIAMFQSASDTDAKPVEAKAEHEVVEQKSDVVDEITNIGAGKFERNIQEARDEHDRKQRALEYQRKTAQFVENFMSDYPQQEPVDYWDPLKGVKDHMLHDQAQKRGIFQKDEAFLNDDFSSAKSEVARQYDDDWREESSKKGMVPARYYSSMDRVRYRVCLPSLNKKAIRPCTSTMTRPWRPGPDETL